MFDKFFQKNVHELVSVVFFFLFYLSVMFCRRFEAKDPKHMR